MASFLNILTCYEEIEGLDLAGHRVQFQDLTTSFSDSATLRDLKTELPAHHIMAPIMF